MPVRGTKLKADEERRTRHKPTHDWIEVQDVPFTGAPPLKGRWKVDAKRWWHVVSTAPHACLWKETDWEFIRATLKLVAAFWDGDYNKATEIRQREALLGMTADARRDLRIRYIEALPEDEALGVTAIEDYKKRLSG